MIRSFACWRTLLSMLEQLTIIFLPHKLLWGIALEWMEARKNAWTARYAEFMKRRLEADIFPQIGTKPIADITAPDLLRTLRIIEARGAHELAHRCKQSCGQIFMYGIATGKADRNPAADLQGALKSHVKKTYAHLKEVDLPEFLKKLEAYSGTPQTKLAVELLMLTFVRTTELRAMTWAEIDFDKAEWRIPGQRMKMRRDHIVPLSTRSLASSSHAKSSTSKYGKSA